MKMTARGKTAAVAVALAFLAAPIMARATTTIVVSTGSMSGWETGTIGGGLGDFTVGPATPPLGAGSFHFATGDSADDVARISSTALNGTALTNIKEMTYSTFVHRDFDQAQAPYLELIIDLNATGQYESQFDDVLFFEPAYQNGGYSGDAVPNQCGANPRCVALDTWQSWDAAKGGWWSAVDGKSGPPLHTLAAYASAHPTAAIITSGGPGVRIQAGGGQPWKNFDGSADAFHAKTDKTDTTFDFEMIPTSPVISPLLKNHIFSSTSVAVSGTSQAGVAVTIREGTTPLASVPSSDGTWSVTLTFAEGSHAVTATAAKDGIISPPSPATSFEVDLTTPAAPVITSPATGSFARQRVPLEGRAEAGSVVQIHESGKVLTTTKTDTMGRWAKDWLFGEGTHFVTATSTDAANHMSAQSQAVSFTTDTRPPTVTVGEPQDGAVFTPLTVAALSGTADDDRSVVEVEIRYRDITGTVTTETASCTGCPGKSATWSGAPSRLLPGRYTVTIYAFDAVGNRSDAVVTNFTKIG